MGQTLTRMTTCTTVTWVGHNAGCGLTSDTSRSRPIPVYTGQGVPLCGGLNVVPNPRATPTRDEPLSCEPLWNFTGQGIRRGGKASSGGAEGAGPSTNRIRGNGRIEDLRGTRFSMSSARPDSGNVSSSALFIAA